MPAGALGGHVWEECGGGTQATGSGSGVVKSPGASQRASGKKVVSGLSPKRALDGSPVKAGKIGRVPEKTGRIDGRAILKTRPVLRDIVNDAS